jgi:hypothetical protein
VYHHPTMRDRVVRERHDQRVRDAERRTQITAAMQDRHERAPWPVVPDHVPAHWVREAIRRARRSSAAR